MSDEEIDVAAIMTAHELHRASPNTGLCTITMGGGDHCESYQLAAVLRGVVAERNGAQVRADAFEQQARDLADKVARVEALKRETGHPTWEDLDAALADQPEQPHPTCVLPYAHGPHTFAGGYRCAGFESRADQPEQEQ